MKLKKILAMILAVTTLISITTISASAAVKRYDKHGCLHEVVDGQWVITKHGAFCDHDVNDDAATDTVTDKRYDGHGCLYELINGQWVITQHSGSCDHDVNNNAADAVTAKPITETEQTTVYQTSGGLGAVLKTTETDPLTSQVNVGDPLIFDRDNPGSYSDNIRWTLEGNVLTISGSGQTAYFHVNTEKPWDSSKVEVIVVEEGVAELTGAVFCGMPNVKTIIVMDAGTVCGNSCFRDLPTLESILRGANLKNTLAAEYGMSYYHDKTLLLTKNVTRYIAEGTVAAEDVTAVNSAFNCRHATLVSYSELISMAKNAIANVPASVLAKLPAELSGGVSDETKPSVPQFSDVDGDAYYADAVKWAVEQGVTQGTTDSTFSPDVTCTVAQILTFMYRAYGSPAVSIANPFNNVDADAYYYDAARWAYVNGLVSGTVFHADEPCTRLSTVTFMWQAVGSPLVTTTDRFTDVASGGNDARAVAWAMEQGITNGTSATTFSPSDTCTRGQIATLLYRYLA